MKVKLKYNANLKCLLKESGITQRELAKRIGEHESIICWLINGRFRFSESKLKDLKIKIVKVLKIDQKDLDLEW